MLTMIRNEAVKLKRTLAVMVCFAAPLCAAGFCIMVMLNRPGPKPWVQMLGEGAAVWAYFLLPMAVTAITVLVAQVEHASRMWNHILALPRSRAATFFAKFVIVVALVGAMTLILYASLYAAIFAGVHLIPHAAATGDPQWGDTLLSLFLMNGAGLMMIVIQLWVALRFKSFAVPLVTGIVGTFFALAVNSAKKGIFLPWLAPASTFFITEPASLAVVLFGYIGGLVLLPAMIWHLSRHEHQG